jgi:hypothetical protein
MAQHRAGSGYYRTRRLSLLAVAGLGAGIVTLARHDLIAALALASLKSRRVICSEPSKARFRAPKNC